MDGKSILFENLPVDPQSQTAIIIDTFGRFYRIPESTFSGNDELHNDQAAALSGKKKKLNDMRTALYKTCYPLLEAEDLCQELIQLDTKNLERFKKSWTKTRVEKWLSCPGSIVKQIVQGWLDLHDRKLDKFEQDWEESKKKYKEFQAELGKQAGPDIQIKNSVQGLIQVDNLVEFEQGLAPIKEKLKQAGRDKLLEDFEQLDSERLDKHKIWIQYSTLLLENLAKDILLVKGVNADGWNHTILKEILHLISFITDIFKDLADKLILPAEVMSDFKRAMNSVESEYTKLLEHLETRQKDENLRIIKDAENISGKVSAKTIRELYILNHLSQKVLGGRLKFAEQDVSTLKSSIEKELRTLGNQLRDDQLVINKSCSGRQKEVNLELAWVPNMIAVVLDLRSKFLLTGATQPACKQHFILRAAAKKIPHLQVGREFASRLARCYDIWKKEKCGKWREELSEKLEEFGKSTYGECSKVMGQWSEEKLKTFFAGEKPEAYSQLSDLMGNEMIICWAVSGHAFEFKSPCPRCAYFYSSWDLNKTTEFFNCAYLLNYLHGWMANAKEDKDFHCAETVAAAKIYAWRHETIGFG